MTFLVVSLFLGNFLTRSNALWWDRYYYELQRILTHQPTDNNNDTLVMVMNENFPDHKRMHCLVHCASRPDAHENDSDMQKDNLSAKDIFISKTLWQESTNLCLRCIGFAIFIVDIVHLVWSGRRRTPHFSLIWINAFYAQVCSLLAMHRLFSTFLHQKSQAVASSIYI